MEQSDSPRSEQGVPTTTTAPADTAPADNTSPTAGEDVIVRGIAADGLIRAYAASTRRTVQEARERHQTSPVATAALGRLLTAGAMMGNMLKDPGELITLSVRGDGPLGGITVTTDAFGHVKGYVGNPDVWLPLNAAGKLDVGGAVGAGMLAVVQDQPWGEPYSSQLSLLSGEIGDDVAAYFVQSEQIPTSVGLGVLVDTDLSVKQSGGFLIQLMAGHDEELTTQLEQRLQGVSSVTDLLEEGLTPTDILQRILGDLGFEETKRSPVSFFCNCSRERTERVLITLGAKEVQSLIDDGEPATLTCNFCRESYTFSVEELRTLLARMTSPAEEGDADAAMPEARA